MAEMSFTDKPVAFVIAGDSSATGKPMGRESQWGQVHTRESQWGQVHTCYYLSATNVTACRGFCCVHSPSLRCRSSTNHRFAASQANLQKSPATCVGAENHLAAVPPADHMAPPTCHPNSQRSRHAVDLTPLAFSAVEWRNVFFMVGYWFWSQENDRQD
jgi:hypothetical protein